jgi:hypothetical protein
MLPGNPGILDYPDFDIVRKSPFASRMSATFDLIPELELLFKETKDKEGDRETNGLHLGSVFRDSSEFALIEGVTKHPSILREAFAGVSTVIASSWDESFGQLTGPAPGNLFVILKNPCSSLPPFTVMYQSLTYHLHSFIVCRYAHFRLVILGADDAYVISHSKSVKLSEDSSDVEGGLVVASFYYLSAEWEVYEKFSLPIIGMTDQSVMSSYFPNVELVYEQLRQECQKPGNELSLVQAFIADREFLLFCVVGVRFWRQYMGGTQDSRELRIAWRIHTLLVLWAMNIIEAWNNKEKAVEAVRSSFVVMRNEVPLMADVSLMAFCWAAQERLTLDFAKSAVLAFGKDVIGRYLNEEILNEINSWRSDINDYSIFLKEATEPSRVFVSLRALGDELRVAVEGMKKEVNWKLGNSRAAARQELLDNGQSHTYLIASMVG